MKRLPNLFIITLLFLLTLFSCRQEEMEIIQPPEEEVLASDVANLLLRTATNDGSYDNILDGASCFNIKLPVTVIANGIEVVIETEEDIDVVEAIFDEFDDDTDTLEIIFPITIILQDHNEVIINDQEELNTAAQQCSGENVPDDDIECIDIQYPITALVFNQDNELIETVVINSDEELYDFLENLEPNTLVTFEFPISLILFDGTTIQVNNFIDLATAIADAEDTCDEDDNNDPNDDDCDDCTSQQLEDVLTSCPDWFIDDLERNGNDLDDLYDDFVFNFETGGALIATNNGSTFNGTWAASGEGNNIEVVIDVPGIPEINDAWILNEIEQDGNETEVELRIGDDELEFETECNTGGGTGGGNTDLENFLPDGIWFVASYTDDGDNQTATYSGYTIDWNSSGSVTATNGTNTNNGTWQVLNGGNQLLLNFSGIPFDEFNDDWDVLMVSDTRVELQDVSGGNGGTDVLIFEKQ